jgi:hypothetical protein
MTTSLVADFPILSDSVVRHRCVKPENVTREVNGNHYVTNLHTSGDGITLILCVRHHAYFETHKTEYETWKEGRLGTKAFNLLMLRAHRPGKRDDVPVLMWLKQEMKKQ